MSSSIIRWGLVAATSAVAFFFIRRRQKSPWVIPIRSQKELLRHLAEEKLLALGIKLNPLTPSGITWIRRGYLAHVIFKKRSSFSSTDCSVILQFRNHDGTFSEGSFFWEGFELHIQTRPISESHSAVVVHRFQDPKSDLVWVSCERDEDDDGADVVRGTIMSSEDCPDDIQSTNESQHRLEERILTDSGMPTPIRSTFLAEVELGVAYVETDLDKAVTHLKKALGLTWNRSTLIKILKIRLPVGLVDSLQKKL